MKAYKYILSKQTQWALNRGIHLIGSQGELGEPAYTTELSQNLFEPLEPDVEKNIKKGSGNEIPHIEDPNHPGKMQAVHSSTALSVNIFQYWIKNNQIPDIAAACGFCKKGNNVSEGIVFEDQYKIEDRFQYPANIDVVFWNSKSWKYKRFAIELSSQKRMAPTATMV